MQAIIWGLFISASVIQIGCWAFFVLIRSRSAATRSTDLPGISVIICAHDEEKNLRELIPLLLNQDHPNFEIIIVEDRSNDGTFDFLLAETSKYPNLKMVQVRSKPDYLPGKKYALTLGIKAASNQVVLLTEPGCRPAGISWVSGMAEKFNDQVDFVLGVAPFLSDKNIWNTFLRFENILNAIYFTSWAKAGLPLMGLGRNLAYRKQLFLNHKGFNKHLSSLSGDDKLFVNQHATGSNTNIAEDSRTVVYSPAVSTLSEYFVQKKNELTTYKEFRLRDKLLLTPFFVSFAIWIPTIAVTFSFINGWWVLVIICFRWLLMILAVAKFKKAYQIPFTLAWIPVQDIQYGLMHLMLMPAAIFTKKRIWKI